MSDSDDELIVDNLPTKTNYDKALDAWAERVGPCHCGPECDVCWNRDSPCTC